MATNRLQNAAMTFATVDHVAEFLRPRSRIEWLPVTVTLAYTSTIIWNPIRSPTMFSKREMERLAHPNFCFKVLFFGLKLVSNSFGFPQFKLQYTAVLRILFQFSLQFSKLFDFFLTVLILKCDIAIIVNILKSDWIMWKFCSSLQQLILIKCPLETIAEKKRALVMQIYSS